MRFRLSFFFGLLGFTINAQVFKVDTLQYNGNCKKFINMVFLGDGYTAAQQDSFKLHVGELQKSLFGQTPWKEYINYFNVFAVEVVSNESGAKHPNTAADCANASPLVPVSDSDNYFGSTFDYGGAHRGIYAQNQAKIASVLAANFPQYDIAVMLVNSPYYGGFAKNFATLTRDKNSGELFAHEIGHSFGGLADEYWVSSFYAAEWPNMTAETNNSLVRWNKWISSNGVGNYPFAQDPNWHKPHNTCKMQFLGKPYCSVCSEAIIEKIHELMSPIVRYSPDSLQFQADHGALYLKLDSLIRPVPNTLKTFWYLDGAVYTNDPQADHIDIYPSQLANGQHTVGVGVLDTGLLLRSANHFTKHIYTITWKMEKVRSGIKLNGAPNEISYIVFPNPTQDELTISVKMKSKENLEIVMYSLDGKRMETITEKNLKTDYFNKTINLATLAKGTYLLVINIDGKVLSEKVIKE